MTSSTSTPEPRDPRGPAVPEGPEGAQPAGEPGPAEDFVPPDTGYSSTGAFPETGSAAGTGDYSQGSGYSQQSGDYVETSPPSSFGDHSTADVAKDEAANVKGQAADSGKQVAGVAKEEAGNVAAEAGQQAKDLLHQTAGEVSDQAHQQQQRLAGSVHSLADELGSMASASDQSGPMTDLVRQGADKGSELARWLENRQPGELLDDVRSFARRRPMAFLAGAALAGVVAGRLTKGLAADSGHGSRTSTSGRSPQRLQQTSTRAPASLVDEVPTQGDSLTYSAAADDDRLAGSPAAEDRVAGSPYEPYQDSALPSAPRDDVNR